MFADILGNLVGAQFRPISDHEGPEFGDQQYLLILSATFKYERSSSE